MIINEINSEDYTLLSFDTEITDNNETITNLLNLLEKYDVNATFFVTIEFVKANPNSFLQIVEKGHEIGCHTINHPYLTRINCSDKCEEIQGCKDYLKTNYNISVVGFRAPYRRMDASSFHILKEYNYLYDASVFTGFKLLYPNFFIKEIYTNSYGILPIDDYIILNYLKFDTETYFWLLNNYKLAYKSFSFHPHLIMEHSKEFEEFLSNQTGTFITHKDYMKQ